jgi:hypothetical protein
VVDSDLLQLAPRRHSGGALPSNLTVRLYLSGPLPLPARNPILIEACELQSPLQLVNGNSKEELAASRGGNMDWSSLVHRS